MSVKKKRTYSQDYKTDAVGLADRIGVPKASEELGINPANIRRWRNEGCGANTKAQSSPSSSDLESENRKLKREINDLKKINEVLKKATAFFSGDQI